VYLIPFRFQIKAQPIGEVLLVFYNQYFAHRAIGN
jgi:hypothetical protein